MRVREKLWLGYYVLMVLAVVMGIAIWGMTLTGIGDLWRFVLFIIADILLIVIIGGFIYITREIRHTEKKKD